MARQTKADIAAAAYEKRRPLVVDFMTKMGGLMADLLNDRRIDHAKIDARAKSVESFKKKLESKRKYINPLEEVTDLCGLRITVSDLTLLEPVVSMLTNEFNVDEENSTEKGADFRADQFGYISAHFILSLGKDRENQPEYKKFKGQKFEVQVRTELQHAWAVVDHRVRYKGNTELPLHLQRRLFAVAALLELADRQFEQIILEVSQEATTLPTASVMQGLDDGALKDLLRKSIAFARLRDRARAEGVEVSAPTGSTKDRDLSCLRDLCRELKIRSAKALESEAQQIADNESVGTFLRDFTKKLGEAGYTSVLYPAITVGLSLIWNRFAGQQVPESVAKASKLKDVVVDSVLNAELLEWSQ